MPVKSEKIIIPDFRKDAFAESFYLRNLRIPAHAEFRMQEKQGPEFMAAGQISGISSSAAGKAVCSEEKILCEAKRIFDLRKADPDIFEYLPF
jgi:hypothetical protein